MAEVAKLLPMNAGRYIAFEGVEGCGKSTHVKRLAAHLDALVTREPGGTAIGSVLRGLVLNTCANLWCRPSTPGDM
ncbi:MAG: hypothetical protein EBV66_04165 [Actinobacteria bacterium]|nr:hypothetical protein [Actinomycetota bacterium]